MDLSIQLKSASGAICTLSLSFNNDGPLGTFFRYICDHGTYIARYDDLIDGREQKIDVSQVDVSMNGIELQDREFLRAIEERREPNASVEQVLPCYRTLANSSGSSTRRTNGAGPACHEAMSQMSGSDEGANGVLAVPVDARAVEAPEHLLERAPELDELGVAGQHGGGVHVPHPAAARTAARKASS